MFDALAGIGIPNLHLSVKRGTRDQIFIGSNGRQDDLSVMLPRRETKFASLDVPHVEVPTGIADDETRPIDTDFDALHRGGMKEGLNDLLSSLVVPRIDKPVVHAQGNEVSVGMHRDAGESLIDLNGITNNFALEQIPRQDFSLGAGRNGLDPKEVDREAGHGEGLLNGGGFDVRRVEIPQMDGAVFASGQQSAAIA